MSNIQINHYFFSNSGITDRDIWHCSHNMWQGLCNGTVSVHPSVCLSVPAINFCSSMRRVCCCGSGGQEISIDCGTAGAQLQWRCTMAVWQSAAEAEHWVDTSPTLLYREIFPAVLQFPALSKRDSSASLGMWHVRTLNRITIGSLGHRSDRPVIGGDLLGALVPAGWGRLILMYSLSTSGSTQPGERPVTTHSGDVSSTL